MMALLLKDVFLMRRRSGIMLLAIAIFVFLSGVQGGLVNTVMATMMPLMLGFTTFAYDQNDGWEAYACALPFSRKLVVQSKYVLALGCILLSIFLVLVIGLLASSWEIHTIFSNAVTQFVFGAFFVSINYPLIFKFGFEKSRLYYILVMVALMSIGSVLASLLQSASMPAFILVLLPIASICCFTASYLLSCSIMKKKEFSGS